MSSDESEFLDASSDSEEYIPVIETPIKPVRIRKEPHKREKSAMETVPAVQQIPPALQNTTYHVQTNDKILRINGADRTQSEELVFNVDIMNVTGSVFVSNQDMKKHFIHELLAWYEKYITFGESSIELDLDYDPKM